MQIACILIGMLCGNLGAVVARPLNLGLLWNSVAGGIGGGVIGFLPQILGRDLPFPWYAVFLAAAALGMALMLLAGVIDALRHRGL
jgi:uncharacterized membrane protein YeaQ/YmgE (transglycosylase-associated protein family)